METPSTLSTQMKAEASDHSNKAGDYKSNLSGFLMSLGGVSHFCEGISGVHVT